MAWLKSDAKFVSHTQLAQAQLERYPEGAPPLKAPRKSNKMTRYVCVAATALADLLLDQRRALDALAVLGDDLRHDGKLLRAALALRLLGETAWRDRAALLSARFAAARERGESVHLREEARLHLALLDQPGRALELAQANWRAQREPWDARLLLESAVAADTAAAAEPVLAWLDRTGFEDPALRPLRDKLAGAP